MHANTRAVTRKPGRISSTIDFTARIARTGMTYGHDGILAARAHLRSRLTGAQRIVAPVMLDDARQWNMARQRELEHAIDRWGNEGGAYPANRSPTVSLDAPFPGLPRYFNEIGVREIRIGVAEFHCIGALPPQDHPHVYLNMAGKRAILCPYCSTAFIYDERLRRDETEPAGCFYAARVEQTAKPSKEEAS